MIKDLKFRNGRITRRFSAAIGSERSIFLASSFSKTARAAIAEANSIAIEEVSINLGRLPEALDGLRIIHLSDIHHSPLTSIEHIKRAVSKANDLNADIVALTGDYVSHEAKYIEPVAQVLSDLKSKYGTFACLGNHDHWTNPQLVTTSFRNHRINVLINQGIRISIAKSMIWMCGVDDYMVGKTDLNSALTGSDVNDLKILLAHNPIVLYRAAQANIDLVLSGHTHGGQVKLREPRERVVFSNRPRALRSGLHRRKSTQIYITRGIGTVVLPIRYQCPPEISVLKLRSTNT